MNWQVSDVVLMSFRCVPHARASYRLLKQWTTTTKQPIAVLLSQAKLVWLCKLLQLETVTDPKSTSWLVTGISLCCDVT